MLQLFLKGFAYDLSGTPIILLTDEKEEKVLPIWVGVLEAHAIAVAVEGVQMPRPLTHDLIINICSRLGAVITEVEISDLRENTFYARIHLNVNSQKITLDARPSDAIAVALKASAPIYLQDSLFENLILVSDLIDEDTKKEIDRVLNSEALKKSLH